MADGWNPHAWRHLIAAGSHVLCQGGRRSGRVAEVISRPDDDVLVVELDGGDWLAGPRGATELMPKA